MIRAYVELKAAGVPVGFAEILGMALRRSLSRELVTALVINEKAGLGIDPAELEAHALAGGDVREVALAAVSLQKIGEPASFRRLAGLDLDGQAVVPFVRAYASARQRHPDFRFVEMVRRAREGEDVVAAAERGDLAPVAELADWSLRAEFGPLPLDEIRALMERSPPGARFFARRPEGRDWERVTGDETWLEP